ncbi:Nucleolar protein 16 [Exophiala xenobiotica]|nr:Nucleolar protein 16 [Exophiala xenobiotica]KAK5214118.1 Nucleolar protein 16 [Exophiala xenobiotica]KAK5230711.1 Nucleolar protein 16 [Exophiala xenobiotica]KAK5254055.1 Nucleolar protein 16 [Exophiala xenobiotica]KAK5260588.1 Nucleolar protein 16 [Exophiala xenobiotica]
MGRERQKKKNRSSLSKVKPKSNRTKAGKKKVNFLGNATIAKNWDRKLTVSQNYKRLGLSSRLNAATGGTEKKEAGDGDNVENNRQDSLAIAGPRAARKSTTQEVQVERDPETGRILRVIRPEANEDDNPLNDPLNDIMDIDDKQIKGPRTGVVAQLEAEVAEEEESLAKKQPRKQSQREEEWIARLVEKHGDDIKAMVRDRKLNSMQQTEGDISRRVKKWKAKQEAAT